MDRDRPKRVLIVDDSEDLRESYRMLFESVGYDVSVAENGQVALGVARSCPPDAVVVDVAMPVMDGLEFLHHLRSDFAPPLPPVIVCSGFSSAESSALAGGAYAFVLKPASGAQLLALVAEALDQRVADPAALKRGRAMTEQARSIAGAIAEDALRSTPFEKLTASLRELLALARGYFEAHDAFGAVLRNDVLTMVSASGVVRESPHAATSIGEVILSGSTLVLRDVTRHPAFARDLTHLPGIRSVVGVPVVTPAGASVGAICLTRNEVVPFTQEDVMILGAVVARAARLIERVRAGEADPFRDFPLVVTGAALGREVFDLLIEMELRLAAQSYDSVELALVEAGATITPAAVQAAQRAVEPRRWAIGALGARRVAFFKRGADAADVTRQVDAATEALRTVVPVRGVGCVSVAVGAVHAVDVSMLFELAERELAICGGSGEVERLSLGPASTPAAARRSTRRPRAGTVA